MIDFKQDETMKIFLENFLKLSEQFPKEKIN